MGKLTEEQNEILIITEKHFSSEGDFTFAEKMSSFINNVFPQIESLNSHSPLQFDKIQDKLLAVILKQDISLQSKYLDLNDNSALKRHNDDNIKVVREKIIVLENNGNTKLYDFFISHGKLIDDWRGKRAIKDQESLGYCYIATMVYNDYNHPKVMQLRQFRGQLLLHYKLGRIFVKYYYAYSPLLVNKMENQKILINT
jgi:hypothetical protein